MIIPVKEHVYTALAFFYHSLPNKLQRESIHLPIVFTSFIDVMVLPPPPPPPQHQHYYLISSKIRIIVQHMYSRILSIFD